MSRTKRQLELLDINRPSKEKNIENKISNLEKRIYQLEQILYLRQN